MATAARTTVALVLAWADAGSLGTIGKISPATWLSLALSGLATGGSWLLYYYAIQAGAVSVVVRIDKLSIPVSIAFAWPAFRERLTRRADADLALIVAGTLAMTAFA